MRHLEQKRYDECGRLSVDNLGSTGIIYRIPCFVRKFSASRLDVLLITRRTFVRQVVGVKASTCASDPDCLSDKMALLKNQRTGLVDPDTPKTAYTKTSNDGKQLKLVVCKKAVFKNFVADFHSFLMSLILTGERSMRETILTFRLWISGTALLRI